MRTAAALALLVAFAELGPACTEFPAALEQGHFLDVSKPPDAAADAGELDEDVGGDADADPVDPQGCAAAPDGTPCDDGLPCTAPDACAAGVCTGPPNPCDDGDLCTADSCDPVTGCRHQDVGPCTPALPGWKGRRLVNLLEPKHGPDGAPTSLIDSHGLGFESTLRRVDEPVEIPLVSVHLEHVAAYLPLDGSFEVPLGHKVTVDADGGSWVPGMVGQALRPGPRVHVQAAPPDAVPLTLMFWAEVPEGIPDVASVVGFVTPPGAPPIQLGLTAGAWTLKGGPGVTATLAPATEGWQHVALTWEPQRALGRFYLDGLLTTHFEVPIERSHAVLIVGESGPPGSAATGNPIVPVDELAYFHRVLDPLEVGASFRLRTALGAPFVPDVVGQADWDDVRVTTGADDSFEPVPFEVVGRRPFSDSGPGAPDVAAYWRFEGTATPTLGAATSDLGEAEVVQGAFAGDSRALRFKGGQTRLWTDRTEALAPPFALETWVRISEATPDCKAAGDGAFLLQTASAGAGPEAGWALRVCDGRPRFEARGGGTTGHVEATTKVEDGRWHHVLVDVRPDAWTLYVDGVPEHTLEVQAGAFPDALNPITVGHGYSPAGKVAGSLEVTLDDLIVHRASKGPGYVWQRVHPVVPTVRLLASSAPTPPHFLRLYAVHLGNPEATWLAPGEGCDTLLAGCLGYAGWWRVEGAPGLPPGFVPDVSGAGRHATLSGQAAPAVGASGEALALSGDAHLSAALDGADLSQWTVEALVRPSTTVGAQPVVMQTGEDGARLSLGLSEAAVSHGFGDFAAVLTEPGALADVWVSLAGRFDGATLTVGLDQETLSTEPAAAPPAAAGPLLMGGDGGAGFHGLLDDVRLVGRPLEDAERLRRPRLSWRVQ